MVFLSRFVIFIILLTSIAIADDGVVGHMSPLSDELLSSPAIIPDCPFVIKEWRGKTKHSIAKLEKLGSFCELAINKFDDFLKYKKLSYKHNNIIEVKYSVSIIPDTSNYRNLNDTTYRFFNRGNQHDLYWAYTSHEIKYIFLSEEAPIKIWVHEIFHVLSNKYGLFESHHAWSFNERLQKDEQLAKEFTIWLGLGET